MGQRWINDDVVIYERKLFGSVALVAINKHDSSSYSISGLNTAVPAGTYTDYLNGLVGGLSITVSSGSGGNNPVTNFTLPAHTVSVWQLTEGSAPPEVGSMSPTSGQAGVKG